MILHAIYSTSKFFRGRLENISNVSILCRSAYEHANYTYFFAMLKEYLHRNGGSRGLLGALVRPGDLISFFTPALFIVQFIFEFF